MSENLKISQIDLGSKVKIQKKTGEWEDWILVEKRGNAVIVLKEKLLPNRRIHSSNIGYYAGCDMDNYLSSTGSYEGKGYLDEFADDFINCLTPIEIGTYTYGQGLETIVRRCFLASEDNLFGNNTVENDEYWNWALQRYYSSTTVSVYKTAKDSAGTVQNWWLRSPNSATQFRYVGTGGTVGNSNANYTYVYPRPCLAVSNDTIVSPQGDTNLEYLVLSNPTSPYNEVSGVLYLGESTKRPKKARVIIDKTTNLIEPKVEVSNNAKDENPVWVEATGGVAVNLSNTTKETDKWQVGVRLYGKSNGTGYFTEPIVIVEGE